MYENYPPEPISLPALPLHTDSQETNGGTLPTTKYVHSSNPWLAPGRSGALQLKASLTG